MAKDIKPFILNIKRLSTFIRRCFFIGGIMIPEMYKCVKAEIKVLGEEDIIYEQGIDVSIDGVHTIFDHGFRTITYRNALIKEMKLYFKNSRYNTD